eukprot:CAMPEP_0196711206 /NCGR_PEP_ID=MMETSP1090-20130531/71870_1 /TAXON_ID=37098 /ORGANISM="Isochrysis sp, Strain CCMP1244" /LENGTH=237 /DNA_ID=CAMNT_0042051261 /DNA_START=45 /DNA_END=756 /DNA_ORIENTATION=+
MQLHAPPDASPLARQSLHPQRAHRVGAAPHATLSTIYPVTQQAHAGCRHGATAHLGRPPLGPPSILSSSPQRANHQHREYSESSRRSNLVDGLAVGPLGVRARQQRPAAAPEVQLPLAARRRHQLARRRVERSLAVAVAVGQRRGAAVLRQRVRAGQLAHSRVDGALERVRVRVAPRPARRRRQEARHGLHQDTAARPIDPDRPVGDRDRRRLVRKAKGEDDPRDAEREQHGARELD